MDRWTYPQASCAQLREDDPADGADNQQDDEHDEEGSHRADGHLQTSGETRGEMDEESGGRADGRMRGVRVDRRPWTVDRGLWVESSERSR